MSWANLIEELFMPRCQSMHSSGVGVQVAAAPAAEHVVLQVAAALEAALPWRACVPPIHVSTM